MNDAVFLNNFIFNEFRFPKTRVTDNSHGVSHHFLGCIKHGRGLIVSKDRRLELETGDLFYIPKGLQYRSSWIAEDGEIWFDSIGFSYFPSQSPNGYILQKIPPEEEILQAYSPLSQDKAIHAASIGQLYTLLGKLEQVMVKAPVSRMDAVLEHLTEQMHRDPELAIADYAAGCGVSEALLYLYVKRALQKTPNALRQEVKCQKAIQLLQTTSLSVEEIGARCGFSSASYFRKVLAAVVGKTPSEIRREANQI